MSTFHPNIGIYGEKGKTWLAETGAVHPMASTSCPSACKPCKDDGFLLTASLPSVQPR